jgi:hypothetical protein
VGTNHANRVEVDSLFFWPLLVDLDRQYRSEVGWAFGLARLLETGKRHVPAEEVQYGQKPVHCGNGTSKTLQGKWQKGYMQYHIPT